MPDTCWTCAHFASQAMTLSDAHPNERTELQTGACRRYPPKAFATPDGTQFVSFWPEVHRAQWCGEYQSPFVGGSPC